MWEAIVRSALVSAIAHEGERLRVHTRRRINALADEFDVDIWICESCGETRDEALVAQRVDRVTRRREGSVICVCRRCRDRLFPSSAPSAC